MTEMEICDACNGAGGDNRHSICGKCDGAGGYAAIVVCPLCDDTGYKDYAGFRMDPCDHGLTHDSH